MTRVHGLIHIEVFRFPRALSTHRYDPAAALVSPWAAEDLRVAMSPYDVGRESILLDPDARNHTDNYVHRYVDGCAGAGRSAGLNDWQATFTVDKALAKEEGKPTLALLGLSAIG